MMSIPVAAPHKIFGHLLQQQGEPVAASVLFAQQLYAIVCGHHLYSQILIGQALLQASSVYLTSPELLQHLLDTSNANLGSKLRQALGHQWLKAMLYTQQDQHRQDTLTLLRELTHFQLDGSRLVIVDLAELLFMGLDEIKLHQTLTLWEQWARQQDAVIVLVFRAENEAQHWLHTLSRQLGLFSGLAHLDVSQRQNAWEIFHWFGTERVYSGYHLRLSLQNDNLHAQDRVIAETWFEPTSDQHEVFVLEQVIPAAQNIPSGWHVLPHFSLLFEQALQSEAATFVLVYDANTEFSVLARHVFTLRKQCSLRIKLVVREVDSKLRYNQQALLMKFGVNLLVPDEVSYSRFVNFHTMLQGQLCVFDLPEDDQLALATILPEEDKGYLPVHNFVESINDILHRSRDCPIQCVLLRFKLAPKLSALDALRYCKLSRAGDLCSATEDSVYVFLFACQEVDIGLTLRRIFKLPIADLFVLEERYLSLQSIRHALHKLQQISSHDELADLTPLLAQTAQHQVHDRNAPPIDSYPSPPAAKHAPLTEFMTKVSS